MSRIVKSDWFKKYIPALIGAKITMGVGVYYYMKPPTIGQKVGNKIDDITKSLEKIQKKLK